MTQKLDKALGEHITLDSDNIPADTVIETDIADESITNAKLVDDTIEGGKVDVFKSAEITGTGSEVDTAHGLGRIPVIVIVSITENDGTALDIVQGTHDATNVKVTVTGAEIKYTIVAF